MHLAYKKLSLHSFKYPMRRSPHFYFNNLKFFSISTILRTLHKDGKLALEIFLFGKLSFTILTIF
jgi:hypothetical protein